MLNLEFNINFGYRWYSTKTKSPTGKIVGSVACLLVIFFSSNDRWKVAALSIARYWAWTISLAHVDKSCLTWIGKSTRILRLRVMAFPNNNWAGDTPVLWLAEFSIRCTKGRYIDHFVMTFVSWIIALRCRKTSLLARSTIAFSSLE